MAGSDTDAALSRFVDAQGDVYAQALQELHAGRKQSHWMWFVFPQLRGLGTSAMSQRYAIADLDEAQRYLAHPLLGARLLECCRAVLACSASAHAMFGSPDDLKLHSCMTLFAIALPGQPAFERVIASKFAGEQDGRTVKLLGRGQAAEGGHPR